MVITCENCNSRFRVDESLIPPGGRKVRCSKCKHIFLAFPYREEPPKDQTMEISPPEEDLMPYEQAEEEITEPTVKVDLQGAEGEEEGIGEPPEGPEGIEEVPPPVPREASRGRPFMVGLLVVLLLVLAGIVLKQYGVISWPWSSQEPPKASLVIDRAKLNGNWERNDFVPRIFVIKGVVENRSKKPRAFIKVKGILMGKNGSPLKETEAYCGNPIPEKDLRTKSPADLKKEMMNREGLRGMNRRIGPGASVPFTLVFFDVPPGVESFGAEVMEASYP